MKNKNIMTFLSIILLLVLVFSGTFAYLRASMDNNSDTTNTKININNVPLVTINNNSDVNLNINYNQMLENSSGNEYMASMTTPATIQYSPNDSPDNLSFCYTVEVTVNSDGIDDVYGHENDPQLELLVENNLTSNIQRYDITGPSGNKKYYFSSSGAIYPENSSLIPHMVLKSNTMDSITDTWKISLIYHNYDYDQSVHIGKSPHASLKINETSCNGLSGTEEGGLYRYQGTQGNVDNYICFGTYNKDECVNNPNNYMYRIIGINNDGDIKVLKNTSIGDMVWGNVHNVDTKWNESVIYQNINGASFLNNETYIPNNTWKSVIVKKNWPMPTLPPADHGNRGSAQNVYQREILDQPDTNKVLAKIGIMYVHDYYYSLKPGGHDCSASTNDFNKCLNSWFNNGLEEWTMSYLGQTK